MKNIILGTVTLISFLAVISFAVWWQVYRYQDCKLVGHTKLYCIMNIGK